LSATVSFQLNSEAKVKHKLVNALYTHNLVDVQKKFTSVVAFDTVLQVYPCHIFLSDGIETPDYSSGPFVWNWLRAWIQSRYAPRSFTPYCWEVEYETMIGIGMEHENINFKTTCCVLGQDTSLSASLYQGV